MGSIALDNGESVYIHDGTGSADPVAISAAEGSSVANLMKNRERFDYTWADSTERTGQTGMVQGSRGYQEDTKTEYIYDNSVWRLATPYIEFTGGTQSLSGSGVPDASSGWSVSTTNSTDTTLVTVSGGTFTFVRAGIYSIMVTGSLSALGSIPYQNVTTDSAGNQHVSIGPFSGLPVGTVSIPAFRIASDNTPLYFWITNTVASDYTNRTVRITRIG